MSSSTIFCDGQSAFAIVALIMCVVLSEGVESVGFDANYKVTWGNDHFRSMDQGAQVQLSMDINSGAGFASKLSYGSGFFNMRIRLPNKNSAGVVTAFYLSSNGNNHDELDFEFLGNKEGKPITLQTNVFVNGKGDREQRILLWFDPTADFHSYKILWNQYHTVFYVDDVPIRELKSKTNKVVVYPTQAMQVQASLWNGEAWATDGGRTKINWSDSPFIAGFQGFDVDGCPFHGNSTSLGPDLACYSTSYWWNQKEFEALDAREQRDYEQVRKNYMNYDYCSDRHRYPTPPPECMS